MLSNEDFSVFVAVDVAGLPKAKTRYQDDYDASVRCANGSGVMQAQVLIRMYTL